MAALRQPTNSSVTGLPSAVMNRAVAGIGQHRRVGRDVGFLPHPQLQTRGLDDRGAGPRQMDAGLEGNDHREFLPSGHLPGHCLVAKSLKACRTDKPRPNRMSRATACHQQPGKVHKGSHHHETPGCSEDNGDRRLGGRCGGNGGKGGDHGADIRAGSRRLAWRLVLEPGRGPAARRRPPRVHPDADRARRAQASAVERHHAGYLHVRHRQCHRGRGIVRHRPGRAFVRQATRSAAQPTRYPARSAIWSTWIR